MEINTDGCPRLDGLGKDEQIEYIKDWFGSRYFRVGFSAGGESEDPDGLEFSIRDVIEIEFGNCVGSDVLNCVVSFCESMSHLCDFSIINGDYSARYEKSLFRPMRQIRNYTASINDVHEILSLEIDENARCVLNNMLYAFIFSVYEAYLAESFAYIVINDRVALAEYVKKPSKRNEHNNVSHLNVTLEQEVEAVQDILGKEVWHRSDRAFQKFERYCNICVKYDKNIMDGYVEVRNDIVHRAGKSIDGDEVILSGADVRGLSHFLGAIVNQIEVSLPSAVVLLPRAVE